MIYYEILLLITPDISQENYDLIKNKLEAVITSKKGVIKNYDRWGKYLLAYPIKKHTYGIYVLLRFGIGQDVLNEVLSNIKVLRTLDFNLLIMRYVFVRLGKAISETYCRPDSLEDSPRREKSYDIDEVLSRKIRPSTRNQYEKKFNGAVLLNDTNFFDEKVIIVDEKTNIEGSI